MKRTIVLLAAAALALTLTLTLTLTGCATESGAKTDAPSAGTNRPAEKKILAEPTAEPTPTVAPVVNPKLGETFTYEDGLAVTVSAAAPFTPGEYAAGIEGQAAFVAFTFTIVNGTAANFDPAMFYVTIQSANVEGSQVFDTENGMEGSPSTTLLPGREAVFTLGFGVTDPADIVMDVSPGPFTYDNAIFTS